MSEGNEVTVYEGHPMTLAGRPSDILAEAQAAAEALMGVVKKAGLSINFGGKKDHLQFEAWQTLGKFYGMTVKCTGTKFVQFGSVQGFESTSVVVDRYGEEVSRAEAMCLNDEDNWKSKMKYGYLYVLKDGTKQEADPPKEQIVWVDNPSKLGKKMPKREKVKMGEEAVPLFQLKSMAQTRSNAKALRNVLAWIAVLAGYAPTSAEEMTPGMEKPQENGKPPMQEPAEKKQEGEKDLRAEITRMIKEMAGSESEGLVMLKTFSGFMGKHKETGVKQWVEGKDDVTQIGDKALPVVYGKAKEEYEKWQARQAGSQGDSPA